MNTNSAVPSGVSTRSGCRTSRMALRLTVYVSFMSLSVWAAFAQTPAFSVAYAFSGGSDGSQPAGPVIADKMGNLFGTTRFGGDPSCSLGCGVVFQINPTHNVESSLHVFNGPPDGANPVFGVIQDLQGDYYGAAAGGDGFGSGIVFRLDATGTEAFLHRFSYYGDFPQGADPNSGLVGDLQGNLYGVAGSGGLTLRDGGAYACRLFGCGVVFKIGATGVYTVLHAFAGQPRDGALVGGTLTLDKAGNLYGTTSGGGTAYGGVVFELDSSGKETILHNFSGGLQGAGPYSGVIRDENGNLYGVTFHGGSNGFGMVFKIDAKNDFTMLYSFTGAADGSFPTGKLALDAAGNLYGTASMGGNANSLCENLGGSCGVVFKIDALGNETVLYSFNGADDGMFPDSGITLREQADGTVELFGATQLGGTGGNGIGCYGIVGCGTVFVITLPYEIERLIERGRVPKRQTLARRRPA